MTNIAFELFERHVTVCYDVVDLLLYILHLKLVYQNWELNFTVYRKWFTHQEFRALKTMTSLKHFSTADVCILTYPSVKLQCVFEWCPRWKNLQEIENYESLVGRAAERIREAQGKYKKWAQDCARGVWGHAPRKYWDLECVLGTHEVPFRTHIHTSRLLFFISSFRLKWGTS